MRTDALWPAAGFPDEMGSRYDDVMSLSVRRGFVWPAVELYGGFAGFFDYGHNGALLKRRWEDLWLETFLGLSDDYHLIDTTTILPEISLKASGHVDHFTDVLVSCASCKATYRGDHLIEAMTHREQEGLTPEEVDARVRELGVRCARCGGTLGPAQPFHMMFPVSIGPAGKERAYLRPETAQGVYLNFKREFESLRRRLPLGLAIIGRAYRNEISPRQAVYRMREFLQAELQIFFDPGSFDRQVPFSSVASEPLRMAFAEAKAEPTAVEVRASDLVARGLTRFYVYHLVIAQRFYLSTLGVPRKRFRFAELDEKERAFYNKIHFDIQIDQPSLGGFREVGGVHYRGDYDLTRHATTSKSSLEVPVDGGKIVPHVLELSFGIDRNLWALLDLGYHKGDRSLLYVVPRLAPITVGVFPLFRKGDFPARARSIYETLRRRFPAAYDDSGSIGRRYARIDEIGVPFAVTIDHTTLEDGTVTVRERDSSTQVRVPEADLADRLDAWLMGRVPFPTAG